MKIKELRESSVEELSARRRELKQEALNLRIQQSTGAAWLKPASSSSTSAVIGQPSASQW